MEIQNISDTYEYSARYSVILCDLWGVIHNGEKIHKHSHDFLEKVKNDGKKLFLYPTHLDLTLQLRIN